MKKLDQPIHEEYLPLKLYLDDLNEIERIIKESSATLEIEAEGFQFVSVGELADKLRGRSITGVKIKIDKPYSTIELDRLWAKLYVSSSETFSAGLFHKLDEILKQARRPVWFLYNYYFVWTLNILLPIITNGFTSITGVKLPTYTWALSAASVVWVLWVLFIRLRHHSQVIIASRSASGSFWVRKKDDIILVVISAIIGAILGVFGTLLVNHLTK